MTKLHDLAELGQSIWVDYVRRGFTRSGELQTIVDQGVRGVTSNPTIFEAAIARSDDYEPALQELLPRAASTRALYEALVMEDIGEAADVLRPVYDASDGADGFVSLEVSPRLAYDTEGTVAEARRLFAALDRPNVMIKVPATPAGIPAIEALIAAGVNVNVTLIFALDHYRAAAGAYLAGLERLAAEGGALARVASVASIFLSRIDTAVDKLLVEGERELAAGPDVPDSRLEGLRALQGRTGVATGRLAYACFQEIFRGERWERLAAMGARVQRPLWASTGTKSPAYSDTLYVDTLIAPHTVNTLPPATLSAFLDHGTVALSLEAGMEESREQMARLAEAGVDVDAVTARLQEEGVAAFASSFDSLMTTLARLRSEWRRPANLGAHQEAVDRALDEIAARRIVARIWSHDYTVWKPDPTEIANRLGWLHTADVMVEQVPRLEEFAAAVRAEGIADVLLLGMGGASRAAEVLNNVFARPGMPRLAVLDSTLPEAILAHAGRLGPQSTLFIVATKSGSTIETLSLFRFFYDRAARALGPGEAGDHFVAITDPGGRLEELARTHEFRATFLNDPNVGGRYSALSFFGLLPAALVGVDVKALLERARALAAESRPCDDSEPGVDVAAWLGVVMAELARAGRDKLTLLASPALANFGDWLEQLVAESTGKEGKGILPVVGEPLGTPANYGNDRLFVYLRVAGDETYDAPLRALEEVGHPVVRLHLRDAYDLGEQFFLWEMATAVAGHRLGVNPFFQPDVEAAKERARRAMASYAETGGLPEGEAAPVSGQALAAFLATAQAGDYVALQAFLPQTPQVEAALEALRLRLRNRLKLATTVGYGPRFLHSTGQLHKGDAGRGLFVQFTAGGPQDVPIPGDGELPSLSASFRTLAMAQALGDEGALRAVGRRVIRFHLGEDVVGGLDRLLRELEGL